MRIRRNHYEIFGLPHTASQDEIRLRFLELVRKFHPDRSTNRVAAERLFTQINVAHRVLRDPNLRADYDVRLTGVAHKPSPQPRAAAAQVADPAPAPEPASMGPDEALRQAQNAYARGDRSEAARCCLELFKSRPADAAGHHLFGDILADQGKRSDALDAYRRAHAADSKSRLLQGKIQRTEEAIAAALKQAASAEPASPAAKKVESKTAKKPVFPFARR